MSEHQLCKVAVIGGGPAGLMAAEVISHAGIGVDVYDAMPSLGRKFLQAGVGGLNLTHSEDYTLFCQRFGNRQAELQAMLDQLPPISLRTWAHQLGIDTFIGSSGRVFPAQMKAAPLLRAWLHRLRLTNVQFHVRHRWLGWHHDGSLRFMLANGEEVLLSPRPTILALGGASWPHLGSNGAWVEYLKNKGIEIAPLESANCGFEVEWPTGFRDQYAGSPLKSVGLTIIDHQGYQQSRQGELLISHHGVEGSLIYAFSSHLRQQINAQGSAQFWLDLSPDRDFDRLLTEISQPRGNRSLSSHLQRRVGVSPVKIGLLKAVLSQADYTNPSALAKAIKALPIQIKAARPIAEAISSAGGVKFDNLDKRLMLVDLPGTFVAGEMLDWEAPTGGYLLTACLATGLWAGQGMLDWLKTQTAN